jgi:hypothetical protein
MDSIGSLSRDVTECSASVVVTVIPSGRHKFDASADQYSYSMSARSNKHIKKFNQLVEVHDPDGVEQMATITSREESRLHERLDDIAAVRSTVESLTPEDFFDESERAQIDDAASMNAPAEVAASHREEMLSRLDEIEAALEAALEADITLDASDDLGM